MTELAFKIGILHRTNWDFKLLQLGLNRQRPRVSHRFDVFMVPGANHVHACSRHQTQSDPHLKKQLKATRYRIALSFVIHLEEHVKTANPQRNPQRKKGFQRLN